MKVRNVLKSAMAVLACFGTLIPQSIVNAADSQPESESPNAAVSQRASKLTDLELDKHGRLIGVLVNSNGKPEVLKKVEIRQGKKIVVATKTDQNGRFTVSKLRGGVYEIISEDQAAAVRVWANGTAPPKAKSALLLVTGEVTRGQGFIPTGTGLGLIGVAAGVAGLTFGIINMQENDDLQAEINRLEKSLR